jgi:hypothetical protein
MKKMEAKGSATGRKQPMLDAGVKGMEQKSANPMPDVGTLPTTGGPTLDKAGIKDQGYLDKKGTAYGEGAMFNMLPPGTDIEDQKTADIRPMQMKTVTDLGYPGDGWTQ